VEAGGVRPSSMVGTVLITDLCERRGGGGEAEHATPLGRGADAAADRTEDDREG
jgi:hypothetical protein